MNFFDVRYGMKVVAKLGCIFNNSVAEVIIVDKHCTEAGPLATVVPTKVIKDNTVDGSLTSIVGTGYRILVGLDKIIKEVV